MKKRTIVFAGLATMAYLVLVSYKNGPAANGYDCTGAHGASATCNVSGCHGYGAGPVVTITMFLGSQLVTTYTAGQSYTVHIHGSGTGMKWWGFQFAAVKGTGTSQSTAGTYVGLAPAPGLHTHNLGSVNLVEHSSPLQTSVAGSFDTSFTWNAPATYGTGTITMYCSINAVNHNGSQDPGDVSGNTSIALPEVPNTSVSTVPGDATIKIYPNPVTTELHLTAIDISGQVTFNVYNSAGRKILAKNEISGNAGFETVINTIKWPNGLYILEIFAADAERTFRIIKQ
jgi:hypothetical protein